MLPRLQPISSHLRRGCGEKQMAKARADPKPAPSREAFSPALPFTSTFTETPIRNPGTVSQFGMRRLRQSVHPAISANATANPSTTASNRPRFAAGIVCFSPQSPGMNARAQPPTTLDHWGNRRILLRTTRAPKTKPDGLLRRIFTQRDTEVNEPRRRFQEFQGCKASTSITQDFLRNSQSLAMRQQQRPGI